MEMGDGDEQKERWVVMKKRDGKESRRWSQLISWLVKL